jgi:formylglycine-generating enzyme required for sulfatase activity
MPRIAFLICVVVVLETSTFVRSAVGDTFGIGTNSFEIEFVPIRNPGNPPDANPNPAGAVPYKYRIGKYEVSEQMIEKANALGGLGITKDTRDPDKPATSLSWFEAARFVNWLNISTGYVPAYKFDASGNSQLWQSTDPGYDASNLYRNKLARYFLPSVNEWHKAAYYDPVAGVYYDYPTGSDTVPDGIDFVGDPNFDAVFYDGASNSGPNDIMNVGLLSPYGTFGQGGNVAEWHETAFDQVNNFPSEQRTQQGGAWGSLANVLAGSHTGVGTTPTHESEAIGLRIARVIPEPNGLALLGIAILIVLFVWNSPLGARN